MLKLLQVQHKANALKVRVRMLLYVVTDAGLAGFSIVKGDD